MIKPHEKPKTGRCSHKRYRLTCKDYEDLRMWAKDRCQICRQRPEGPVTASLFVDHDWSLGWWAVRGLLCRGCNGRPSVDGWANTDDKRIKLYLARPWWSEMAQRNGLAREIHEPDIDGRVSVWPEGWIFRRGVDGLWGCQSASYRKGRFTWKKLNMFYGPFSISAIP